MDGGPQEEKEDRERNRTAIHTTLSVGEDRTVVQVVEPVERRFASPPLLQASSPLVYVNRDGLSRSSIFKLATDTIQHAILRSSDHTSTLAFNVPTISPTKNSLAKPSLHAHPS